MPNVFIIQEIELLVELWKLFFEFFELLLIYAAEVLLFSGLNSNLFF